MENMIIPSPQQMQNFTNEPGQYALGQFNPRVREARHHNVFVALGLHEHDPGYEHVTQSFQELGTCTALHESLWLIHAKRDLNHVFKKINTSMMDRRIGSNSGHLVLNPHNGCTKWYFSSYISSVIDTNWNIRNNFFVAFKLKDPRVNFKGY